MKMRLKHYLLTSSCAFVLTVFTIGACAQQGVVIERLNSVADFRSEIDTLSNGEITDLSEYDYQIRYYEKRNFYGKKFRYGTIVIKGDSMINYYHSKPSIVGDPFSATPVVVDSFSSGVTRTKFGNDEIKWLKQLEGFSGFYSQHPTKGNKNMYPRSWVRYFIVSNRSGQFFGIVEYGSNDVDYNRISPKANEMLKHVVAMIF